MSLRFATLLLLAPALAAQSIISPAHFANAEGPSYNSEGLGDSQTPYRFLQVHDDLGTSPRLIKSLSLRRDGTVTAAKFDARTVVLDLFVSSGITNANAPSALFDANHGTNKVTLASFKQVRLPETLHGSLPSPFEYTIPFDQPFSHTGQGSLCWEIRIQVRQTTAAIYCDSVTGASTNPAMAHNDVGTGCKSANHTTAMQLTAYGTMNWTTGGGTITYSGNYAPFNSVDYLMIGTSETSFFGVPLPLEIAPATAPSGRCLVYNNSVVLIPVFASATGSFSTNVGVPATRDFHGGRIFTQTIALEPSANTVGIITSNMAVLNWVAPFTTVPVGQVNLSGSLGASGTARANTGYVVRFD